MTIYKIFHLVWVSFIIIFLILCVEFIVLVVDSPLNQGSLQKKVFSFFIGIFFLGSILLCVVIWLFPLWLLCEYLIDFRCISNLNHFLSNEINFRWIFCLKILLVYFIRWISRNYKWYHRGYVLILFLLTFGLRNILIRFGLDNLGIYVSDNLKKCPVVFFGYEIPNRFHNIFLPCRILWIKPLLKVILKARLMKRMCEAVSYSVDQWSSGIPVSFKNLLKIFFE